MRRLILLLALVSIASSATAQNCPRGMLQISGPASYVATRGVQALNLTHGFTIECWVQSDAPQHGGGIADKGTHLVSFYGIFVDTGGMFFGSVKKTGPIKISSPPIDSFSHWHHIAYTFTPGDSTRLYIDSFEVASTSTVGVSAIDSSIVDSLRIGLSATGVSFIGSIDEFRVWNAPRTITQIRSDLFGIVATDPALVLYYSFDDGIGYRRIHDFSGHGRDGYLQGANVAIVQSTSPVLDASPGWQLAAKEQEIIIPTLRCRMAFDTVIHIYNVGPRPESIKKYAFFSGRAFSITSNFPIPLPPDSNVLQSITLHFEPSVGGVFIDTLSILDTNDCGGTLRISVKAVYDSVGLTFSPNLLNFDSVLNCGPRPIKTVRVTNVSSTDSVTLVSPVLPAGLLLLSKYPKKLGPSQSTIDSFMLLPGALGPLSMQTGITLDKCSRTAFLSVAAIRQQPEWSAPTYVNFGTVASNLAGITRDTMLVIKSTGNVTTSISSVTSSDTILTILDDRRNEPRTPNTAKDTLQLHFRIHPQTCGHSTARLHIKGTVCATDTVVLISIDVPEPKPLGVPSFDVGRICPKDSVVRIVHIVNPNDQVVRLDTTTFSKNYVFFTPPLYPNLIQPHDSIPLEFLFQPATDGDFVDTAFLQMSPCGTAIAVLRGSRGYGGVTFGTSLLSFGRGCDASPITKTVTLANSGARSVTIIDTQQFGSSRFNIRRESLPFTMNPGESKQFSITYTPTLGSLDTGSLTLIGGEGCAAIRLPFRGSREHGNAKFLASQVNFDTVCPGNSNIRTVRVQNLGVDSIDIASAQASGNGFTLINTLTTVGDTATITLQYTGYHLGNDTGTLVLRLDNCGTILLLPLRGMTGPAPSLALSDTTIDFSRVKVGATATMCVTISNPSCIPLSVTLDSAALAPFIPERSSLTLAAGEKVKVCFTFVPSNYGSLSKTLHLLSDSAPPRTITLSGIGFAPDVRFAEHTLDFGYVLRGSQKTLDVNLSNVGNDASTITASKNRIEYSLPAMPTTLNAAASGAISVSFNPTATTGLVLDTLIVNWSGHLDTVYLRGQGTNAGMIASATALNFGDVHVTDSATLPLYITATQDFPKVQTVKLLPNSSLAFSDSAVLPYPIANDHDTFTIAVKYHPLAEQRDTGYLLVSDGKKNITIMLTGRGVEAHVQINPISETVDTEVIGQSQPLPAPINIKNVGTYRLFVDSLVIGPDFQAEQPTPNDAILPGDHRSYNITFTPHRARLVVDSLYIYTTSPDKVTPIAFEGVGIYPIGTGPSFGYRIAATQTSPGERDTIPVSIYGTRLAKIDADSIRLEITYDPSMTWMHGIISDSAHRMTKTSDSTIECVVKTNAFSNTLFSLDAEALIGPHSISYIHIKQDEPHADIAESIDDGLYQVIDCGGTLNGIVLGGGYKVQSISPNPADDQITLAYQLGVAGPVAIDLIDELGRTAKHIESAEEREGAHSVSIDVSSLPAGRYVYRIESLDFKSSGSVLLVR